MVTIFNGLFLLYIYVILLTDHIYIYAQFLIHISIAKSAYNSRESTIFYYNSITLSASYGHVTFIASRSCKSSRFCTYTVVSVRSPSASSVGLSTWKKVWYWDVMHIVCCLVL